MLDLIKNPAFWTTTALLAPLAVNLDPADFEELQTTRNRSGESSTTTITIGGGAGTHGTGVEVLLGTISEGGYGCDGSGPGTRDITTTLDFEEDFIDAGGELDFKPAGKPLHIGVRGGYIREQATFVGEQPVNPLNDEVVEVPPGVGERDRPRSHGVPGTRRHHGHRGEQRQYEPALPLRWHSPLAPAAGTNYAVHRAWPAPRRIRCATTRPDG